VEWGSADRNALKARVLLTLRSAPASAGAAVFDVSAPTLPITRT
jgi:cell division protein FtsQ